MAAGRGVRSGVEVRRAAGSSLYEFYVRWYLQHHATKPELVGRVHPLDQQDFNDAASRGEVFEINPHNVLVGLVILRVAYQAGMRGFLVVDQVVNPLHGGQRIAALAQRVLASQLCDLRRQIVFGTIAPQNASSLKTALNAGRVVVSKCSFLVPR